MTAIEWHRIGDSYHAVTPDGRGLATYPSIVQPGKWFAHVPGESGATAHQIKTPFASEEIAMRVAEYVWRASMEGA